MIRRKYGVPALIALVLLPSGANVRGEEVCVPGETYTPDLIGPWTIDSYAERQAQGGGTAGLPPPGELWEAPRAEEPESPGEAGPTPQPPSGSPPTLVLAFAAETMNHVTEMKNRGVNIAAVNASWGSSNDGGIDAAVDNLLAADVMLILAAGNSGSSNSDYLGNKAGVMNGAAT